MSVKYDYTKDINANQLSSEIRSSSIITALDYVSTLGSSVEVWMKAALSDADYTNLNTIVADHTASVDFGTAPKFTHDSKQWVHPTSRPRGTTTSFTSRGDATSDTTSFSTDVGNGEYMTIRHSIGDPLDQTKYVDFNLKENPTYAHEGYALWSGCDFDRLTLEVVPQTTDWTVGSNTNFNIYNGYMIVPAAGNGTVQVNTDDMKLVEMVPSYDTGVREPGFWKADYDSTDQHKFVNITPAPNGDGIYNMFAVEVPLVRFANNITLIGDGFLNLNSNDVDQMGQGMRIRLLGHTDGDGTDHDWKFSVVLSLDREKTC